MMRLLKHYRKKGSVLIVVIGLFVALFVLLASFLKSTTSRVHTTKKLGDTMHARELASSLAVLTNHYIKSVELKKSGSELKKILSMPIDKMNNGEGKIKEEDLNKYFGSIYTTLIDSSGLNKLKIIDLSWKVYKDDFTPLKLDGKDSPYPREKTGLVCTEMKFSYLLPGTKSPITEEYSFSSDIKVVANLLPVLSKFSFYCEEAFDKRTIDDDLILSSYFNVVDTTEGGILNSGSPRPWVINNGGGNNYDNYKDYLTDKRGFIYLGGGTNDRPIILGIARGFSSATQGDFGEDFHFYKNGRQGYWKLREVWTKSQPIANILEAEIGLCNDTTDSYKNWQKKFGTGRYFNISRYNSIFRLYGTDIEKSPTLVYGYVDSMHGSVKAIKNSSGHNYLFYFDDEEDFINSAGYGDSSLKLVDLYAFGGAYVSEFGDQATYKDYVEKYTTKIIRNRYNRDFTYYLAKEKGKSPSDQQYPLKYCTDLLKGELMDLCSDEDKDDVFLAVPNAEGVAEFRNIYSNSVKLVKLEELLDPDKLCIDGSSDNEEKRTRIAYQTTLKSSKDAEEFLTIKGLMRGKELDLNGWVYFDCANNELILNDLKNMSQGGIIAKDGNITIKGNIKGSPGAHLSIIALNGSITIERGVENIDASLIAVGNSIKLEGNENEKKLYINGNIVIGNLPSKNGKNVDTDKMKRGLFLKYNTDLSAIPFSNKYTVEEDKTESPLLMFNLNDNSKMLD